MSQEQQDLTFKLKPSWYEKGQACREGGSASFPSCLPTLSLKPDFLSEIRLEHTRAALTSTSWQPSPRDHMPAGDSWNTACLSQFLSLLLVVVGKERVAPKPTTP